MNPLTWVLALSIAFSSWEMAPPSGLTPYVVTMPDGSRYIHSTGNGGDWYIFFAPWGMYLHWATAWQPCQQWGGSTPCDAQTWRLTAIETGINGPPMTDFSNRWVRTQWRLRAESPFTVVPIVWQAFHESSHRIFSCPPVSLPPGEWSAVSCDIYLPTVEGLVVNNLHGLGVGLDLMEPYQGWLLVADLNVWISQQTP